MTQGTKPTYFNFDAQLKRLLQDILDRENVSFTQWVHDQAQEYVKRHGAGNPATPLEKWIQDPQYVACPTILEAEGFNWDSFTQEDLGRIQLIMVRELDRVKNTRRRRQRV